MGVSNFFLSKTNSLMAYLAVNKIAFLKKIVLLVQLLFNYGVRSETVAHYRFLQCFEAWNLYEDRYMFIINTPLTYIINESFDIQP